MRSWKRDLPATDMQPVFYVIGKCAYYIKALRANNAQLRARNKSCAAEVFGRESVRSTLLF